MLNFMIKKIRVSGAGKKDGIIEFQDGINIIMGRSNTGKTWILKCINYLFSCDNNPFSSQTGYSKIEGIVYTKKFGDIIIKRELNSNEAEVECDNEKIRNGIYLTNYKKKGNLYLNDLWIRIIGLDETIKVPKNKNYERERISWERIANIFFADEEEIDKSDSLILKKSITETVSIATLYFLLTGDYKKSVEALTKIEIERKKAVVDYIEEQIVELTRKRSEYILRLEKYGEIDFDRQLQVLSDTITDMQGKINELVDDNIAILSQICECQKDSTRNKVLLERYESLESQYKADLQRLDFIFKGETAINNIECNNVCPFCGNAVEDHDKEYKEILKVEAKRIVSQLAVIVATERSVKEEIVSAEEQLEALVKQKSETTEEINKINGKMDKISIDIKKYNECSNIQTELNFINQQIEEIVKKKSEKKEKNGNDTPYYAKREFEEYIGTDFDLLLNNILKECNYTMGYASWDFKSFDILINGVAKKEYQGKGYRSFLNSVVELMLYDYFNREDSYIKPGILMIDTPLLGFDEEENKVKEKTLKNGLYNYIINHKGRGQIIIVDNINVIPDINFEKAGVKITTYYKDEKDGHTYGFLPDWREDISKN